MSNTGAQSAAENGSVWVDPLAVCTIRTAHLKNKLGGEFEWTRNNGKKYHQGIDLAAEPGTPIRAVANGRIHVAKRPNSQYSYGSTSVLEVELNDLPPDHAELFARQIQQEKQSDFSTCI
ncbi:M23 family metallopeptidase [Paraburkholderia sp. MPAMCS5]|uniref:M23 family metallopeptidase n=1 Tax=Paraburkholderia sp. MPAMCS5 TaxID=3112563 RepID=UPI002E171BCC|nr:M23 family metallopeptidase [Paraburkholderia sp. MPAMCS5]